MKTIDLTYGFIAIVDDEDYAWLMSLGKWYIDRIGAKTYAGVSPSGKHMHRLLLPNAKLIDHKDGNGLNNRKSNIREVTSSENMLNPTNHLNINNTSGRRGVFFDRHADRWIAAVRINGKQKKLGTFEEFDDACAARDRFDRSLMC